MWRPKVDIWYILRLLSTLFIEVESIAEPGTHISARLARPLALRTPYLFPEQWDYRWSSEPSHLGHGLWLQPEQQALRHLSHLLSPLSHTS